MSDLLPKQRWMTFRRNKGGQPFTETKVGDVSPKHHVGGSRLAPAYGRQFVLSNGLESNYHPNTGTSCLAAMRPFGERSPT
ncbi:MAG: hypothetical protein LBI18_09335 [Planctomycetaceae bacterium]|nr:hypothetical protein [Planctomycetaceae bacterium]